MTEEQAVKIIGLLEDLNEKVDVLNGHALMINDNISSVDSNNSMGDYHLSNIDSAVNEIKNSLE